MMRAALTAAIARANDALDWIEARQGPLDPNGYARIETTVRVVREARMLDSEVFAEVERLTTALADMTADRDALSQRVARLEGTLRACRGIIHEGQHGGRPTDPEHQERCQRPACRRIHEVLLPPAAPGTGDQEAQS